MFGLGWLILIRLFRLLGQFLVRSLGIVRLVQSQCDRRSLLPSFWSVVFMHKTTGHFSGRLCSRSTCYRAHTVEFIELAAYSR